MGREIRRVPLDWQHPTEGDIYGRTPTRNGSAYFPQYDRDFASAVNEWKAGFTDWENGNNPDRDKHPDCEYWEWVGGLPRREYYRARAWTSEEATAYQVYETVSEGTPVSPVLATLEDLREWLIKEAHMSEAGADQFIEWGSMPSGFVSVGKDGLVTAKFGYEAAEPF